MYELPHSDLYVKSLYLRGIYYLEQLLSDMAKSTKVLALLLEVGLLQVRILEAAMGGNNFGT